jgi:hypothetical protein
VAGYSVSYTVIDNASKQIDAINRRIAQTRAPLDRMSRQVSRFVDVSGLRKVATGFEWIGKAAGSVLRTLTSIVPVMGTIVGAASIAGMVKLVSTYADWSRELVAAADNIGTTTQQLQQFEDATRLAGGNAAEMRDSLKGLHDNLADFNRGGANAAVTGQWANKLKINLRDANGQIRSATDLMPELLAKIAAMPDPADRAAAAQALLGSSGDKLVETFRQSSKSFGDWFNDVKRYKDLTDEQKQSLQRFGEAQGRLGVDFDRLGQQITAMVARDFGPLLEKFATFVEQNTPAILGAIDQLSQRFAAWLNDPETGKMFVASIKSVADSLVWVINHLDTIKTAVEVIAGLFALKWAVGIVQAIGAVTEAIGATSAVAGAVAGTGLMGALGAVAAIAGLLALGSAYETPENRAANEKRNKEARSPAVSNTPTYDTWTDAQGRKHDATTGALIDEATPAVRPPGAIQKQSATGGYLPGGVTPAAFHPGGPAAAGLAGGSEFWDSMARAVTKGFEDAFDHITGFGGGGAGGGGGGGYAPGVTQAAFHVPVPPGGPSPNIGPGGRAPDAPLGLPPGVPGKAPELLGQLAGDTSWGDYGTRANNPGNMNYAPWQKASGRFSYMDQTEGQQHTMAVYNTMQEGVADAYRLMLRKQEQHGKTIAGALSAWSTTPGYAEKVAGLAGLDPNAPFDVKSADPAMVQRLLQAQFKQEGRRGSHTATADQILGGINLGRGTAPPVAAAPPATVPQQAPVNGAVDVSITHKNPPPNSAVTATGSGAVNVAPPRVEHQNMADI